MNPEAAKKTTIEPEIKVLLLGHKFKKGECQGENVIQVYENHYILLLNISSLMRKTFTGLSVPSP